MQSFPEVQNLHKKQVHGCPSPLHTRLVIYYSQSITITFENIQSITITIKFENFKSITITITLASITSITFYYILLQFGAKLRGNFNTKIKLTGYSIHIILLKMLQIMPYKDKISQIYHLVYLQFNIGT